MSMMTTVLTYMVHLFYSFSFGLSDTKTITNHHHPKHINLSTNVNPLGFLTCLHHQASEHHRDLHYSRVSLTHSSYASAIYYYAPTLWTAKHHYIKFEEESRTRSLRKRTSGSMSKWKELRIELHPPSLSTGLTGKERMDKTEGAAAFSSFFRC
ncbi:uncharacterized protein B0T23DRAFT_16831 [Neurospora hispaniola]|uniref:Uncharacterized protein n=1 Tax=Neurospora hispaniola TaxID=588809 RepID=A0AAJ0MV74_9PEZI|nr:hypothetical protein B0T23DRAFT_16831 [Neurospora hispaniola]